MVKERLCPAAAAAKSREGVGGARSSRIAAAGTFSAALQIYNCTFSLLYTTQQHILCDTPMLEALHIYTVDPLLEQHNLTALHVHIMCGLHSCIALL